MRNLDRGEFEQDRTRMVQRGELLLAKRDVDYTLWNRLVGVQNPKRI